MSKIRSVGVAAVFLVGCAVGGASSRFVVPAASAQQAASLPVWEYQCKLFINSEDAVTEGANALGAQRWELVGVSWDNRYRLCFKRPKL